MRFVRPALALTSVVLAACSLGADADSAESAHTAGDVTWPDAMPELWGSLDRATLDARLADHVASPSHPVAQRADEWVRHFDGLARAAVVEETGHQSLAPIPYARLVPDKTPRIGGQRGLFCIAGEGSAPSADGGADGSASDGGLAEASASGVDAAAPMADAGSADAGAAPAVTESLVVMMRKNERFSTNLPGAGCVVAPEWSAASGLSWFNGLGGSYKVEDHGTSAVVSRDPAFVAATPVEMVTSKPLAAQRVAIQSAMPAINVASSLVTALSETAFAVAVAREVGRYHRAHETTGIDDRFDFLYERTDVAGRPQEATDATALLDAYRKVHVPRFLIPTQKMHPRVVPTLLQWLSSLEWDSSHPCFEARRYLDKDVGTAKNELTQAWSFTETASVPLSASARAAVLKWEPKMAQCIDAITLTDGSGPSTFPHGTLAAGETKLPRTWFLDHVDPTLKAAAADADLAAPTLRELTTRLETVSKSLDAQASELEKRLLQNRVAVYTETQEADEVALELAARSGISPRKVFDAFFEMMALEESADANAFAAANAQISVAECKSWFDAGFVETGPDGQPRDIYVPGGLSFGKPSWCARMADLLREARVHAFTSRTTTGPFDPAAWGDLQTQAATLTSGAPNPPALPPTPAPSAEGEIVEPIAPKPHVTATGDDGWKDEGWSPPARPGTVSGRATNKAATTAGGGCGVATRAPAPTGLLAAFFGVLAALGVRRRKA